MRAKNYSEFLGIDRTTNDVDAPQVSFLKADNVLLSGKRGAPVIRGGSTEWSVTGNILGIFGYSQKNASHLIPNLSYVIRHRRVGSTSYVEKLDWSDGSWDAITQGASTSFGAAGIASAAQMNDVLLVCAGRPAYISDINSGNINRLGGPAPVTAPTWTLQAGSLTGATAGYYTFYNPTTGWESSPSPLTSLTTVAAQEIDWSGLETSCAKEGVTKKRLYRTLVGASGDGTYKRVAEINLADTTYANDNVLDASLVSDGPEIGDQDPPPSTSYLCIEYANRFWIAYDNELWYSKVYDGTLKSLEYFSYDRVFRFPAKITGLAYTPDFGKLLVFLPAGHGIQFISGLSESTFIQDSFQGKEGTNFPTSVSAHEKMVVYWGHKGPTSITPSGVVTAFASGIEGQIDDLIKTEYNGSVYIWSTWHPAHGNFFFGLNATDTASSQWEDSITGATVEWADAFTGATVEWE